MARDMDMDTASRNGIHAVQSGVTPLTTQPWILSVPSLVLTCSFLKSERRSNNNNNNNNVICYNYARL